ncbi:spherulin-1A [Stagonosporopsis vannaccii]|nr:spherulin-1A [Stagonosporopsis vannaccii]
MHKVASKAILAVIALATANAFPTPMGSSPNDNTDLVAQLLATPTQIKRYRKLLTDESGNKVLEGDRLTNATIWNFEQNNDVVPGGQGGLTSSANLETFPFLINSGVTMTMGTLGPCGIFLPHVHPRANEFFVVTEGEVDFGTLLEIGLLENLAPNPELVGKLTKNTGTLFPMGSVHYQANNSPDCKPATIYTVLTSEDAGTTPILMDPAPGNATVGMVRRVDAGDFESVRAVTPTHIAQIVDRCLARCYN